MATLQTIFLKILIDQMTAHENNSICQFWELKLTDINLAVGVRIIEL